MKKTNYILFALLVALSTVACEKYIEFDAEVKQPKLVLNGLFNADSTWHVHVSHSLSVIDNESLGDVEDATVRIVDSNGNLVETLVHDEDGNYVGSTMPAINTNYMIEASAPNYTSVSATDHIPVQVNIISFDTSTVAGEFGEETIRLTVKFTDPNEANFYQLRVRQIDTFSFGGGFYDYIYMRSTDPVFENLGENKGSSYGLFRDPLFNGQTYEVTVLLDSWAFNSGYDVEILLINGSEAMYNYRLSYDRYINSNGDPFAQPVQVYSNVENGFGLFAGFSQDTLLVDL